MTKPTRPSGLADDEAWERYFKDLEAYYSKQYASGRWYRVGLFLGAIIGGSLMVVFL